MTWRSSARRAREAESTLVTWQTGRPWLGTVARLFLGAIWLWAAVAKLGNPREFVQTVRAYDATWEWLSKAIGYGLPVLEFGLGVLLVLGVATRLAAAVSAFLFLVFLIALVQAAARGLKLECGCFGNGGESLSTQYTIDILRDTGFLVVAAFLVVWSFTRLSVDEFLARHDYVEEPSAKRMRSAEGQRKYQADLEKKAKEARYRSLWLNGSLAVVLALIALIGVGVQSNRAKIGGTLFASNATVGKGVVFGKPAAATVDIYEDFQCPNCRNLEQAIGKTLDADVRANKAQAHFHPIAILDSSSNNNYSSRAANAALCASDISVDDFVSYHNYLFRPDIQPAENAGGRTDQQLEAYAQSIGLTGGDVQNVDRCIVGDTHKALVEAMTEDASKKGIIGTPTVFVNGKQIDNTLAAYQAAVAEALKNGPAPNPSVTPTPTPTGTATSTASPSSSPSPSSSKSSSHHKRPTKSGSPKK
jgi:protein-disulfide isomerase